MNLIKDRLVYFKVGFRKDLYNNCSETNFDPPCICDLVYVTLDFGIDPGYNLVEKTDFESDYTWPGIMN